MTKWVIVKSAAIAPLSVPSFDAAYQVRVTRGSSTREVVVEFEAPSCLTSVGWAEEVTRQFLPDQEPPQHLLVDRRGTVRVLHGPLVPTPDGEHEDAARWSEREPRRARGRH